MKVLHILNELKHSGAEVMLQVAYGSFKRKGIDSDILSTGTQLGDYAVSLRNTGYNIHHIPFSKTIRFFWSLICMLRTERFDVVHIHTERAFIWYVSAAKLAGVPVVIRTFHNVFLFTSYLRWKRQLQRKLARQVFGSVHTAIGESVKRVEKERFNNDCVLINNWTDVQKFRPPTELERAAARRLYQLEAEDFSVLIVGACSKVKNHIAAFAAVKRVNEICKGPKIVLLHVGAGPSLGEEELFVKKNQIEEHCRLVGTLDDMRLGLYAADAFIMTSGWEGLPIAAVEAMSTGLPVILYNVYGLRDLLLDGKGGLLIEPDEDCLVEALLRMIKSYKLRKAYGEESRKKILDCYSIEHSVNKLIQLYKGRTPTNDGHDGNVAYADKHSCC